LNHLTHKKEQQDPQYDKRKAAITAEQWRSKFGGMTRKEVLDYFGFGDSGSGQATFKYGRLVIDPVTNELIDMKHFIAMGRHGELVGTSWEVIQYIQLKNSAFQLEDLVGNRLGSEYYDLLPVTTGRFTGSYSSFSTNIPQDFGTSVYEFLINQ
jgi:hypothetical protein